MSTEHKTPEVGASGASGADGFTRRYGLHQKPCLAETLPLSLQHVLLFLACTVSAPLVLGHALGMEGANTAFLIQCALFVAGVGTMVQAFGLGPVGNRLPIMTGVTFTFLGPAIAISAQYGYDVFLGSCVVGGLVAGVLGRLFMEPIRRLFPPIVTGAVIMSIGFALVGLAVTYSAGGMGGSDYGSWQNYLLALFTLSLVIIFHTFGKGFMRGASVLMAMLAGFAAGAVSGMVDFSILAETPWFALPRPMHFGIGFNWQPALIVMLLYLVTIVEFVGDTTTVVLMADDRMPTRQEYGRGILCDCLTSAFAGIFNSLPTISYSANIGLIGVTGVASRHVVGVAGIMLVFLGFCPKLAALFTLIPAPVIGGTTLVIFGIIATSGLSLLIKTRPTERDMMVIAVSLAVGLGFQFTPDALKDYPFFVSALINGIPGTAFTAVLLNLALPGRLKDMESEKENA